MREIVVTKDGSHTIVLPGKRVTYDSAHGAMQDSKHVFIDAGLNYLFAQPEQQPLSIFEMGFGTGLNAFLAAIASFENKRPVFYTAAKSSPLSTHEASLLNYPETLSHADLSRQLQHCAWKEEVRLHEFFTLQKENTSLNSYQPSRGVDLIFYDAFAPSAQPELWTKEVFEELFAFLNERGVLVAYCSKGDVQRALTAAGFTVKKLPRPRGKREILRAEK